MSVFTEAVPIQDQEDGVGSAPSPDPYELLVSVSSPRCELDQRLFEGVDWNTLLHLARHHSLVPLLAHRTLGCRGLSLPANIRGRLRSEMQQNLFRNLGLIDELKRILAAWREIGIDAIPYKGPVLAEQLWGSLALRECSDLDILVRSEDVTRAGEALLSLEYQRVSPVAPSLRPALLRNASEEQFRNSQNNILLELQWAPAPKTLAIAYDDQNLWRDLKTIAVSGERMNAPSLGDLVALLTIHGWKHNWSKLIWVADLAALIQTGKIDWDGVLKTATNGSWRRILALGVEMVRLVYGFETPVSADQGTQRLAKELEQNLGAGKNSSYLEWHRNMLRARDHRVDQIRQVANFVFSPGLGEYASVHLPGWAASGYHLVRLGRVLRLSREKILK